MKSIPGSCCTLALSCIDFRFMPALHRFISEQLRRGHFDLKTDAGGVKTLLDGDAAVRAWILRNLAIAQERHGVRRMVLVQHQDCAAFGGSAAFPDRRSEAAFHAEQLNLAGAVLREHFPSISLEAFYANFSPAGEVAFSRVPLP